MEGVFLFTHLVMIICVITIFSVILKNDEEKVLKKTAIPKHVVAVFKTDVTNKRSASRILQSLNSGSPDCRFNFDLNNCDQIVSVQSNDCGVEIEKLFK